VLTLQDFVAELVFVVQGYSVDLVLWHSAAEPVSVAEVHSVAEPVFAAEVLYVVPVVWRSAADSDSDAEPVSAEELVSAEEPDSAEVVQSVAAQVFVAKAHSAALFLRHSAAD
jgi:hypothetical protein